MDRTQLAALALGLFSAIDAAAQIPRDPFSGQTSSPPAAETAPRELPKPFVTRQSDVEIPFNVRGGTTPDSQPTAVRISVSWDQGRSWHFYDERRPEEGRFRFRAKQDGEFWFATQTIDRAGRPDIPQPKWPQLRLVVDTQKPQLLVQAQVDSSGNVNVALSAADGSLNAASLKVEYQEAAGTGGPWEVVELKPSGGGPAQLTGQTTFRPNVTGRAINLRAEVADGAGNIAYHSQRLSLIPPPPKPAAGIAAAAPAADPSATKWPSEPPALASEQVVIPNLVANPFFNSGNPGRLASGPTSSNSGAPGPESLPPPQTPAESPLPPPADPLPLPGSAAPQSLPEFGNDQLAPHLVPPARGPEVMPAPQGPGAETVQTPNGQRPRLTNSRRFSLEYDVETVGPEGLQAVELWGTTDGGRSWVKWGADPDKQSPFDVEVNSEAIYGFRIVIVGRNGLATSSPRPGEAADIWVGVDLTRPAARLTRAAYGQGAAAGKLDIRWEASDANLGSRPITLSLGERADGPFAPLAAGLPNSGQYLWEFDPRSPRQIYLRLEVRDEAGNIAIDQLNEPIKVEGLEPKGRIRNFNPGPEPIDGAFRTPLFR